MFIVGNQQEWEDFENRHQRFFKYNDDLNNLNNLVFNRTFSSLIPRDRVIFSIGRIAIEDFHEILLLAGNGYGIGALKVLRGMYERVVTTRYLSNAPDSEVENFLDYYWVEQHKLAEEILKTSGKELFIERGHGEKLNELKEQYNKVKQKYQVTKCGTCGTKRLNYSWSKRSLIAMADKSSEGIRKLLYEAYYQPLQHTHSTFASIHTRFQITEDGRFSFKEGQQRKEADDALQFSHLLLLDVLVLQQEYFELEDLSEPLDRSLSNYEEIWSSHNKQPSGKAC